MDAAKILAEEHKSILRALEFLERASNSLGKKKEPSKEVWNNLIEFLRGFADRCHHAKEEKIFLPEVKNSADEVFKACADSIFNDHKIGRGYVKNIEEAIQRYYRGEEETKGVIIRNVKVYTELLRVHIKREDVCFPRAQEFFTEDTKEKILKKFEEVEIKEVGESVHQDYLKLLKKIENALETLK